MSILKILEDIGSLAKRRHKLALIEKHRANDQFMRVVKLALDPYVKFYIRKIPSYTFRFLDGANDSHKSLDWALNELEKLTTRQLTGNAGIEHLRNILSELDVDDSTVVERIIGKDLRCGMADGIVNAVIKDFIPTYPCLLARPYDEKNIKNITYPGYSQLKADGLRANGIVEGNKVTLCGRSGREIDLLGHMEPELIELAAQFSYHSVFDGEFVVVDQNGKVVDRKTGNGIINKAIKGTISDEEARQIRFQLWDVIPLAEFKKGVSTQRYKDRFEALIEAVNAVQKTDEDALAEKSKGHTGKFWIIPYRIVNNLEEGEAHFQELLSLGHEGTILKNYCALWEDSRSKHLVKMKAEKTCDLEITGYNSGEGKFLGQVGSLICASSDRLVEVSISGFSDALRLDITKRIKELIGTIVEVMYNERISSKGKSTIDSLFLPRFNCFRDDKFVADSTNEIK